MFKVLFLCHTCLLTAGFDSTDSNLGATSAKDIYTATPVANSNGIIVNSLNTGDVINARGTNNELDAMIIADASSTGAMAVRPMTKNIQTINIEALAQDADFADNNFAQVNSMVRLNANNMENIEQIWSNGSEASLRVENLKTSVNAPNTEDVAIGMRDTGNAGSNGDREASNYEVLFHQDHLIAGRQPGVEGLQFQLMDQKAVDDGLAPLTNFALDSLSFRLDGEVKTLEIADPIANTPETYEGLRDALNALLEAQGLDEEGLEFQLIGNFSDPDGRQGQNLVLTMPLSDATRLDFINNDTPFTSIQFGSSPSQNIYRNVEDYEPQAPTALPVTATIYLDEVGRGSEGGYLKVGSMSEGSNSSTGIQVMDVTVLGDSNIEQFYTTNGALRTINITNNNADDANLVFRNETDGNGTLIDANTINGKSAITVSNFKGSINLGSEAAVTNVDTISVSGSTQVTLDAVYTGGANAKQYVINTGSGNDTINALISGQTTSTSTQSALAVTSTGGNNTVIALSDDGVANTITVTTAAGNDTIFLEADNGTAAVYTIPSVTFENTVLYRATMEVVFAGYEATIEIPTNANGNYIATPAMINQAIINAIASSSELSRLLTAEIDDTGLVITSNTVGAYDFEYTITQPELVAANPVAGEVLAPTASNLNALKAGLIEVNEISSADLEDLADINTELEDNGSLTAFEVDNLGTNTVAGTAGTDVITGTINAGLGNDVISLSAFSGEDTIVITNASVTNKLTILNFENNDGGDVLDFSFWLNATNDPSSGATGGSLSTVRSDVQLANDLSTGNVTITAAAGTGWTNNNLVTIINWSDLVDNGAGGSLAANTAFSATAFNAAALNFAVDTTGLSDVATKNIFLIANDDNAGEYLAVAAETSNAAGAAGQALTSVTVIGVLDFGNTYDAGNWVVADFA